MTFSTTMAQPETIHVMLVEEHEMFREALCRRLDAEPGFRIQRQCGSHGEALAAQGEMGISLIVLSVNACAEPALEFLRECRKRHFPGRVMILTGGLSGEEAVQLVQMGAGAIFHKNHSLDELCGALRRVSGGDAFLEPVYVASLFRSVDISGTRDSPRLTDRDRVMLRLLVQGMSNRDISARLRLSESGVKSSVRQLFDKLQVRRRSQLVKVALEKLQAQLAS
jgi:DNA-binding NarL/FixJ family response regulator